MQCLMCRKALRQVEGMEQAKLSRAIAVNDGGTVEISFGYGSRCDCQTALGFICDDCFDSNRDLFVNHYDGLAPQEKPHA